jgi:hypothetical protein
VVIHCSDARYQPHFQKFLRRRLRVPRYALLAVPGGAQALTLADSFPRFAWPAWRWVEFLFELTRARRVILIAHDDCRWYLDKRFRLKPARVRARQLADLRRVRRSLQRRFAGLKVELYYAHVAGDRAGFDDLG